jgi:hypothetical protein
MAKNVVELADRLTVRQSLQNLGIAGQQSGDADALDP